MVRKVGFGKDKDGAQSRTPTADAVLDEWRERIRAKQSRKAEPGDGDKRPPRGARIFTAIFISIWLVFWTMGIFFAAGMLLASGGTEYFLIIWLVLAIAGWVLAFRALVRLIRGLGDQGKGH